MSTYIPSSENGRDSAPMLYLREPLQDSYSSEPPILAGNVMMYMNFSSASAAEFSGSLAGNSQQLPPNSCIDIPNVGVHDSSVVSHQEFLSSIGEPWRDGRNHEMMLMDQMGSRNLQGHGQGKGLSLSLGSHPGIQFHSSDYRNPNMGFSSFLSPDSVVENSDKADVSPYGIGNVSRAISDSKYLKAAQQLLDEIVNVGKALKQHNYRKESTDDSKGVDGESNELSAAEKQDLQNKMTKLISMLDEVDRRYKQYYHQMQIVVSAFDLIAGCGTAKTYTALALQTISRHFRCLRDAINTQIKEAQRSLGETDSTANGKGVGISRLRFVDRQLRQQRALHHLGMMQQQHTWRPQRGLPETSVSILRAWLFEHFLHPYPKDSDKIMLARKTGLTRSQVSNWFINARVRLWKPMVEEMYKEEAGEMESNSSSEMAPKDTEGNIRKTSADQGEDTNQSIAAASSAFDSKSLNQAHDSEMVGTSTDSDFQNMMVQSNRGQRERLMAAAAYQMPQRFGNGNGGGVSLTLGLQHSEDGSLPPMASIGSHNHSFVDVRGGGVYDTGGGSSVEPETIDFDCVDSSNRQQRFGSSHLLHDFVA